MLQFAMTYPPSPHPVFAPAAPCRHQVLSVILRGRAKITEIVLFLNQALS